VTLITFTFCEKKEESIGIIGLEIASTSIDNVDGNSLLTFDNDLLQEKS
jgi:hypothetical protein